MSAQFGFESSVTITRPNDTTAYAANDVVGGVIEFKYSTGRTRPLYITGTRFMINASAVISGETSYTLQLYKVTPPSAYADNAAWDLPAGDRAAYIGSISLGTPTDLGSTLYVETNLINKEVKGSGDTNSIFAYLITNGAYTPTAERVYVPTLTGLWV